jgi:hypothetical protein
MDTPIGALADGFEDRLVLEEKGALARWGGCLLYLLMAPFALLAAVLVTVLMFTALGGAFGFQVEGSATVFCWSVFFLFVPVAYFLYEEYRSRDFQEVSLCGGRLEVLGGAGNWRLDPVADMREWHSGLSFRSEGGERLTVRVTSEEHRKAAWEQLLPALVARQRAALEAGGELRLYRHWRPLGLAVLLSGLLGLLACLFDLKLGLALGLLLLVGIGRSWLRNFWVAELVLTNSGLRGPFEVPWSEVTGCESAGFFQEVLQVTTQRGTFRLVSWRSPLILVSLIQELRGEGRVGAAAT